jgi:uncharacterized membrane protein
MEAPKDILPDWFWKLLGLLVVAGSAATVYLIVKGIIWLINHITL